MWRIFLLYASCAVSPTTGVLRGRSLHSDSASCVLVMCGRSERRGEGSWRKLPQRIDRGQTDRRIDRQTKGRQLVGVV